MNAVATMKLRSFCFLVLLTSSTRGQNHSVVTPIEGLVPNTTANGTVSLPPPDSSPGPTPGNETTTAEPETRSADEDGDATTRGADVPVPAAATTVAMATVTSAKPTPPAAQGGSSWAYVILVFIVLAIVVLCVILYFLRRASRTYSFDLQRPAPSGDRNQAGGTFEPVYLDDLDASVPKDRTTSDDVSPPANGTSVQPVDKDASEDNASKEQANMNGVEAPPTGTGEDLADMLTDPLTCDDLLVYPTGQQQNETNPAVSFSDPFVEIALEEAPWSDQLLACPAPPSSSSSSSSP